MSGIFWRLYFKTAFHNFRLPLNIGSQANSLLSDALLLVSKSLFLFILVQDQITGSESFLYLVKAIKISLPSFIFCSRPFMCICLLSGSVKTNLVSFLLPCFLVKQSHFPFLIVQIVDFFVFDTGRFSNLYCLPVLPEIVYYSNLKLE